MRGIGLCRATTSFMTIGLSWKSRQSLDLSAVPLFTQVPVKQLGPSERINVLASHLGKRRGGGGGRESSAHLFTYCYTHAMKTSIKCGIMKPTS